VNLSIGALAAAQIVLNLSAYLLVVRIIGVGSVTDAYIAAQAVPALLIAIVGVSLQNVWLPRFTQAAERPDLWREAIEVAQGQALKLVVVVALAIGLTAPAWIRAYLPGFSTESRQLVLWILIPSLIAAAVGTQASVLVAAMRASGRLRESELIAFFSLLFSTGLIAVLLPRFGILVVPLVAVGRAVLSYTALLIHIGRPRFIFPTTAESREINKKLGGMVSGASIVKSTPLVDRYFGAQAAPGALTVFSLAQLGISSLATILERGIVADAVPEFSRLLARGDIGGLRIHYIKTLRKLAIGVACLAALLLMLKPFWSDLLRILLQFSYQDANRVWLISLLLLPGLFVLAGGTAAVSVFYAMGEARVPVVIGIYAFAIGVVVKFALFKAYGILGLAAGASIYLLGSMVAYHFAVMRRLDLLASSRLTENESRG